MASRSDFSPGEWDLLLEGVTLAIASVAFADGSVLRGVREMLAANKILRDCASHDSHELMRQIAAAMLDGDEEQAPGAKAPATDVNARAAEALEAAVDLLERTDPADVDAFKQIVMESSHAAARGGGGGLFHRGTPVSAAESAALTSIEGALGVS